MCQAGDGGRWSGKLKNRITLAISSSKLRSTLTNHIIVRQLNHLIGINYLLGFPRIAHDFLSEDGRKKRKRIKKGCSQPQQEAELHLHSIR